ncbi:hypothetical protein [Rufibacter roseolus]|uniref:hypothetical protein n=1 Tax=Rufibacter roseolus TaxID=2817375 RepID=UPI001B3036F9|nr:hypothetical protein [Rufibacter roseolus]
MATRPLLQSGTVLVLTVWVLGLTILGVYTFGLGRHHTFFQNSLWSTTLLSIGFFAFVTTGLYRGVKLRNTMGSLADKLPFRAKKGKDQGNSSFIEGTDIFTSFPSSGGSNASSSIPSDASSSCGGFELGDLGEAEGCGAILLGILAWSVAGLVLAFVLWFFGEVLLVAVGMFMAMLYWIFYRALRLVFRHSPQTRGHFFKSVRYGLVYTFLYNSWIYGIFLLLAYLQS